MYTKAEKLERAFSNRPSDPNRPFTWARCVLSHNRLGICMVQRGKFSQTSSDGTRVYSEFILDIPTFQAMPNPRDAIADAIRTAREQLRFFVLSKTEKHSAEFSPKPVRKETI